ncbi:Clr5 domain-containing protein [Podospora aff. communis PSN243]|uniref:Clr5 domain-containing protein n=1 Tax=Podospora aff. communis PSN243 TaxID=3040156 RepID=A0AAV9G5F6_9PEZI|nr:Clr5 domain-containing protein [Podospora aff. communis PSN243]
MTKRQGPSAEDWANRRPIIESLYLEQGKELREVSNIMRQTFGFSATSRQYIHRFSQWGLRKNIPHDTMSAMIAIREQRKRQGKETSFTWNGHAVDAVRLDRFEKKEGMAPPKGSQIRCVRYSTPIPEDQTEHLTITSLSNGTKTDAGGEIELALDTQQPPYPPFPSPPWEPPTHPWTASGLVAFESSSVFHHASRGFNLVPGILNV